MWADGEGYRFTRLTEDQVLVDFDHESAKNPVNWTHVSVIKLTGYEQIKLTASHL